MSAVLCTSVIPILYDCCPLYQCPSYTVRLLSLLPVSFLHCSTAVLFTSVLPTLFDCCPLYLCPSYSVRLLDFVPVSVLHCSTAVLSTNVIPTLFDCCPLYQCPYYTARLISFLPVYFLRLPYFGPVSFLHCLTAVLCTSVLPTLLDCFPFYQRTSYTVRLLSFVPVSFLHCSTSGGQISTKHLKTSIRPFSRPVAYPNTLSSRKIYDLLTDSTKCRPFGRCFGLNRFEIFCGKLRYFELSIIGRKYCRCRRADH